jgi:hypothetical protein
VELYRAALEMLLERRDLVRNVGGEGLELTLPQKELLLRAIAYWLLLNGFSDATETDLVHLLAERVEALPGVTAAPEEVLAHLLLRSGVLREPVEGRIDFIHRTFQEYLTARQIVDERSIGLLIEHAHEDQWQEVVRLAAGQGSEDFGRDLIRRLLDRGREDHRHRHRLQLLAIACLETTPSLPRALQEELEAVLAGLIPPRSMSEAKAIASAGEVAVPLLAEHHTDPVATAAPSARALGLIGGSAAMAKLESFGLDRRVTVARELVRSWDYFPAEEYAARVLRDSILDRGALLVDTPEKLSAIRHLRRLVDLECLGGRSEGEWDLDAFRHAGGLRELTLVSVPGLERLPPLAAAGSELQALRLGSCQELSSLGLAGMDSLETLIVTDAPELRRIEGIEALPRLARVVLFGCPRLGDDFEIPRSADTVEFGSLPFTDLWVIEGVRWLRRLSISRCQRLVDFRQIEDLGHLESLTLSELEGEVPLRQILSVPGIAQLGIRGCPRAELGELGRAADLQKLAITEPRGLRSISFVRGLPELTDLNLGGCHELMSLDGVEELAELERLVLFNCRRLLSIAQVAGLQKLRFLDLEGCRGITDLSPLAGLPSLRTVDVRGCSPDLDLSPIERDGIRILGRRRAVFIGRSRGDAGH